MDSNDRGNSYVCVAPDVKLGRDVKLSKFINLYGCEIGDETKIGAFVEVQKNAKIGKRCKISSHTFVCEGVVIEDNVFIGHGVTFINDSYPRATSAEGNCRPNPTGRWNALLSGLAPQLVPAPLSFLRLTIGENAIVGAGSTVTKDVPENAIVAGNPAKILRYLVGNERPELTCEQRKGMMEPARPWLAQVSSCDRCARPVLIDQIGRHIQNEQHSNSVSGSDSSSLGDGGRISRRFSNCTSYRWIHRRQSGTGF